MNDHDHNTGDARGAHAQLRVDDPVDRARRWRFPRCWRATCRTSPRAPAPVRGSTPRPVYEALSKARSDGIGWTWPWSMSAGCARRPRQQLAPGARVAAAQQRRQGALQSITRPGRSIEEAVNAANLHARRRPVVCWAWRDGHTASLFPRMQNLEASRSRAAPMSRSTPPVPPAPASSCAIASPAGLAPAHTRLLLIRGEQAQAARTRARRGRSAGVPGAHRILTLARAARPLVPVTARSRATDSPFAGSPMSLHPVLHDVTERIRRAARVARGLRPASTRCARPGRAGRA